MSIKRIYMMLLVLGAHMIAPASVDIGAEAEIQPGFPQSWANAMENDGSQTSLHIGLKIEESHPGVHICSTKISEMPMRQLHDVLPTDIFPNHNELKIICSINFGNQLLAFHSNGLVGLKTNQSELAIVRGLILPSKDGYDAIAAIAIPNSDPEGKLRKWLEDLGSTTKASIKLSEPIQWGLNAQISQRLPIFHLCDSSVAEANIITQCRPTSENRRSLDEDGTARLKYDDGGYSIVSIGREGLAAAGPDGRRYPGLQRALTILLQESEEPVIIEIIKELLDNPIKTNAATLKVVAQGAHLSELVSNIDLDAVIDKKVAELYKSLVSQYQLGQIISKESLADFMGLQHLLAIAIIKTMG